VRCHASASSELRKTAFVARVVCKLIDALLAPVFDGSEMYFFSYRTFLIRFREYEIAGRTLEKKQCCREKKPRTTGNERAHTVIATMGARRRIP